MGKKSDPPPAPDYSGIARASEASAAMSAQVAREQLAWAKETYAKDREVSNKVIQDMLRRQEELDTAAKKDRKRYEEIFQPLEEGLVKDAAGYTDERNAARAEAAAGAAAAGVSNEYALARTAAQDRLESFGIDPSQTRAGALDASARIAEATARAGAANVTREGVKAREEATGRALRSEALNIGRGYPGQSLAYSTAAGGQGQGAVGAGLQTTASGANTMGTGAQWMGVGNQALGTWGNALTQGYQAQSDRWKNEQQQSSGWMQLAGMGLGIAGGIAMPGLQAGAKRWMGFDDGGIVPHEASPSRGVAIDDVDVDVRGPDGRPVAKGAINVGEFIVPDDVTKWKGEEFFQKLIAKSREDKKAAPARPDVRGVPVTPAGNPARGALPLREVA